MADFLSNGVSALLAFQRALDVTSQNISNVATPGYSRQSVSLVTNPPEQAGNGWVGTGVNVNTLLARKRYAVLHLRERLQSIYEDFWEK